jgi:hypothetical protein
MSIERRRHSRSHTVHPVEYVISSFPQEQSHDGVVANVSQSGLCLITKQSLIQGEAITIVNNSSLSSKVASVRWSQNLRNLYYRVGLEFV